MKSLPHELRTKNLNDETTCHWCGNTGYVVVMMRKEPHGVFEEMGPCPYCLMGYREEFPESNQARPISTTWGPDGFWQGRDTANLEKLYPNGAKPLPMGEQKRNLKRLLGQAEPKEL